MKFDFKTAVKKHQEKEVAQFLEEQSLNEDAYVEEMLKAGFTDRHAYEFYIAKKAVLRLAVFIGVMALAIISVALYVKFF